MQIAVGVDKKKQQEVLVDGIETSDSSVNAAIEDKIQREYLYKQQQQLKEKKESFTGKAKAQKFANKHKK